MPRKPKDQDHEARAVKSAERVLDIFTLLAQCPNGMKLNDIGHELHIPVSSLHALLNTLTKRGFVERDPDSLIYRLSRKVSQILPSFTQTEEDLISAALPVMDRVRETSQETVSLSVRSGSEVVFIARRTSNAVIQVVQSLGSSFPLYATGSGKALLAFLPEEEIDRLYPGEELPRLTANTLTSRSALKDELAAIRERGYAFDNQESVEGVWAVAGCIRSSEGTSLAATSIVVPRFRVTEERSAGWSALIVEAAAEITRRLGKGPGG